MAAITENCIYRSVTMVTGETFVLPPGAAVISTSDNTLVTSSCGELAVAQTKCYRMHWVMNEDWEGSTLVGGLSPATVNIVNINNAWEDTDNNSSPVYIGKMGGLSNTPIDNGTTVSISDLNALENAIASSGISGALSNRKYKYGTATSDMINNAIGNQESGYHAYDFYFRTTDDIAKLFYLEVTGDGDNIIHTARMFAFEINCDDFDAITTDVVACDPNVTTNPNDPVTTTTTNTTLA